MAHALKERYSKLVLEKLRKTLVTKDGYIFNTRYEGDPKAGAVKIPTRAEMTALSYSKSAGLTATQKDTTYVTMNIDKDVAVNEIIDGYDAAAVPDGIVAERLDSAGYALAKDMDTKCIAILENGGTVMSSKTASTKSNIFSAILDADQALTEADVPTDGRYLIVSPAVKVLLMKSDEFIKASDLGQSFLVTGAIGQIDGFNVYVSNNMMKDDTTVTSGKKTTTEFIAGHPMAATRAMEFSVPVKLRDLTGNFIGASQIVGRQVWGGKVTHEKGIVIKRTEAAAS